LRLHHHLWLLHHHSGGDSLLRCFLNYCRKVCSGICSTATSFAFDEKEPNETTTASQAEKDTNDTTSDGTTSATSLRDAHLRIVGWDSLVVVDCSICDIVEETFNLERSQAGLGLSNSGSSR